MLARTRDTGARGSITGRNRTRTGRTTGFGGRSNYSNPASNAGKSDVEKAPKGTRIYLYEKQGVASHDQKSLKVVEAAYPGKNEKDTSSTLGNVGKGASIGATAGSAIPIPGVGTAVGSIVGAVGGLVSGLFGGGPDQTQMDRVLPSLLQPVFAEAGAQTSYSEGTNAGFGTKGLRLTGKEFRPENVMETVEKVVDQLGRQDGVAFNDKGNASKYKRGLEMSTEKPDDTGQSDKSPDIIVSFPKYKEPEPEPETKSQSQASGPKNAKSAVYAIGAAIAGIYFLG